MREEKNKKKKKSVSKEKKLEADRESWRRSEGGEKKRYRRTMLENKSRLTSYGSFSIIFHFIEMFNIQDKKSYLIFAIACIDFFESILYCTKYKKY